jgi:hypothetical protein
MLVEWSERLTFITRSLVGLNQSVQAESGKIPQIMPRPLAHASSPLHYSVIIMSFSAL